jgi:hypothetical protein
MALLAFRTHMGLVSLGLCWPRGLMSTHFNRRDHLIGLMPNIYPQIFLFDVSLGIMRIYYLWDVYLPLGFYYLWLFNCKNWTYFCLLRFFCMHGINELVGVMHFLKSYFSSVIFAQLLMLRRLPCQVSWFVACLLRPNPFKYCVHHAMWTIYSCVFESSSSSSHFFVHHYCCSCFTGGLSPTQFSSVFLF